MHDLQMSSRQTAFPPRAYRLSRARLAAFVTGCLLFATHGVAQATCTTLPFTLQNGQTADATQVMSNFNGVLSCPSFTGNVGVGVSNAPYALTNWGLANIDDFAGNRLAPTGLGWVLTSNGNYAVAIANLGTTGHGMDIQVGGVSSSQRILTLSSNADLDVFLANGDVGLGTTSPTATLYVNGTTFSTTGWSTASDGRLKRNVRPIGDALSLVERLQGVRFEFLPADQRPVGQTLTLPISTPQIGFVAQAVQDVVPEAVSAPKPGTDGVYGVDPAKLVPVLVEAVKEQQAEIDALKAQVSRLTSATHSEH